MSSSSPFLLPLSIHQEIFFQTGLYLVAVPVVDEDGSGGATTGPPGSVDKCFAPILFASLISNSMLYTHLSAIIYPRRMACVSNWCRK